MPNRVTVSSAEFIRNIGYWQNEALRRPISITHHGRERLVLSTPGDFGGNSQPPSSDVVSEALARIRADQVAMLGNLEDGFLVFDSELRVTCSNVVAEAFFDRAASDMMGVAVGDLIAQPLASILIDRLRRVQRSRKCEAFEVDRPEGQSVSVRVFPSGEGVAALFRNTTDLNQLKRRLERAEAQVAAVVAHSRTATLRLDVRGRFEDVDDCFCVWTGFNGDDLVGHRFVDLVTAPLRRSVMENIETTLRDIKAQVMRICVVGKRGGEIGGLLSLSAIHTDFISNGVSAVLVLDGGQGCQQEAA